MQTKNRARPMAARFNNNSQGSTAVNTGTVITYGTKLLDADWLRRRAFFLNHEGTFGKQESMIMAPETHKG